MRNWEANTKKPREAAWGYAQWKPVVYTKMEKLNADLSHALSYPNMPEDKSYIINYTVPFKSLFAAYFGEQWDDVSSLSLHCFSGDETDRALLQFATS